MTTSRSDSSAGRPASIRVHSYAGRCWWPLQRRAAPADGPEGGRFARRGRSRSPAGPTPARPAGAAATVTDGTRCSTRRIARVSFWARCWPRRVAPDPPGQAPSGSFSSRSARGRLRGLDDQRGSLSLASFTVIRRPSSSQLFRVAIAADALSALANSTKPKPRERPVSRSVTTRADVTSATPPNRTASYHHQSKTKQEIRRIAGCCLDRRRRQLRQLRLSARLRPAPSRVGAPCSK